MSSARSPSWPAFTSLVDHLTHRRTVELELKTLRAFAHRMMPRAAYTGVILLEHGQTCEGRSFPIAISPKVGRKCLSR